MTSTQNTRGLSELERIELEFTYGTWQDSCRDEAITADLDDLRYCRRKLHHEGLCAAGRGSQMARWQRLGDRA